MKRFENLKAVLFDLDGTLVNTLPGLTELVNQMRSDFDKPPLSEEKVGKYIGKGMFVLVRRAMTDSMDEPFPEEMFNLAVKSMARHVEAGRYSKGVLYPDTIETIKYVKNLGLKTAIVTNKPYQMTLDTLAGKGLLELVDLVVGGPHKSLHPIHESYSYWHLSHPSMYTLILNPLTSEKLYPDII